LRRTLILLSFFLSASLVFLSCGSSSTTSAPTITTRAFVSQDVSGAGAGVLIVDADRDTRGFAAPIAAGATPGKMVVTPNRAQTLVFSAADSTLTFISNGSQSAASHLTLPGFAESFVVSPDSQTAYVAVPTAPVVGQSPGVVEVINANTGAVTAEVNIPAVRFLSIGNSGNRILAFSRSPDPDVAPCATEVTCLFVITPSEIGTPTNPVVPVAGFDHPVAAFFSSDDNTAFIVNCGAECGGTQASVQRLDLTANPLAPDPPVQVPAATVALVNGTTMYLAGTPVPPTPCTGTQGEQITCGLLTVFDLTSMNVTNTSDIVITDGYHNRIALGANGQLFVGAHNCTEIIAPVPPPPNAEARGCLAIYNTENVAVGSIAPGAVTIPPASGDVTGIQPIAKRNVVYVVQGGELQIYDTTTDKLQKTQVDISGEAVDVKTVDF
jgi:hypothetical protein